MDSLPPLTCLPTSLEDARIKSLPPSAFYIADFITQEEEEVLLNKVSHTPFALDLY
jgi:alkylated DNA repair protein alkB family protein 6